MAFVALKLVGGAGAVQVNSDRVLYLLPLGSTETQVVISGPPSENLNLTVVGQPSEIAKQLNGFVAK